jgi:ribosomal protein S18 acetylase RimI-like enzyme
VLRVVTDASDETIAQVRTLFREYAALPGVVQCLANFENEVATLPGRYAAPDGRLALAIDADSERGGEAVGCAALRRLDEDACEMKRLYVREAFRGRSAGRSLVQTLITEARTMGYKSMLLDTLPSMLEAHKLYRMLGFREISSYQKNPVPGALFFEFRLR